MKNRTLTKLPQLIDPVNGFKNFNIPTHTQKKLLLFILKRRKDRMLSIDKK